MDYEKAWKALKKWIEDTLEDGILHGFNKAEDYPIEYCMYEAYAKVRHEMMYEELRQK